MPRYEVGSLPPTSSVSEMLPEVSVKGPIVRFSEIMYHSPSEDPDDEFIEIANYGDEAVNLQHWCLRN